MNNLDLFNRSLFLLINADSGSPMLLIQFARFVAQELIYLVPLLLAYLWFRGNRAVRKAALFSLLVIIIGLVMNQLIGLVYFHPRPFMSGDGHQWLSHAPESSFPSDHVTVFMCAAFSLLFSGVFWPGLATLILGLGVAWSRIYLGVHYPFDIFGSVVFAGVSYFLMRVIWIKVGSRLFHFCQNIQSGLFRFASSVSGPRSRK